MKSTGYPLPHVVYTLILIIPMLAGCAGNICNHKLNEIPTSVYKNSLHNVFSNTQSIHNFKQSIFKPEFLHYLAYLTQDGNTLDEHTLRDSIKHWNAVEIEKSEQIRFDRNHFVHVASLHTDDLISCTSARQCTISFKDINILQIWLRWQLDYTITTPYYSFDASQLVILNPEKNPQLHKALKKLASNRAGSTLVQHALNSGLAIRLNQLKGSHGYYSHDENTITLDPSVVNYEFNLRYLVHELLHACNTAEDNSITEEVLAELIGLEIQNQITGIPFEINPYLVFLEHILDPENAQLVLANDIYRELAITGIELLYARYH